MDYPENRKLSFWERLKVKEWRKREKRMAWRPRGMWIKLSQSINSFTLKNNYIPFFMYCKESKIYMTDIFCLQRVYHLPWGGGGVGMWTQTIIKQTMAVHVDCIVYMNHLGISLKCRFWFIVSGAGYEFLNFSKDWGEIHAAGEDTT